MKNEGLEFIWIINPSGKIYVQRTFDRNLPAFDKDLFSNLLTSLSSISNSIFNSACEEFGFGGKIVLVKGYKDFQVILSAKKGIKTIEIYPYVEEVGEAFRIEYSELLANMTEQIIVQNTAPNTTPNTTPSPAPNTTQDITQFDNFGAIIDIIFGIQTYIYLEEQEQYLALLDDAISKNYSEEFTVDLIIKFLDNLTDYKVEVLINNIGDNLRLILKNVEHSIDLTSDQKQRYKKIIK